MREERFTSRTRRPLRLFPGRDAEGMTGVMRDVAVVILDWLPLGCDYVAHWMPHRLLSALATHLVRALPGPLQISAHTCAQDPPQDLDLGNQRREHPEGHHEPTIMGRLRLVPRPSLPIAARPAHAEIAFGVRRAVGACSVIDHAFLLGDRLPHRLQLHSLVSNCADASNVWMQHNHAGRRCQAAAASLTRAANGVGSKGTHGGRQCLTPGRSAWREIRTPATVRVNGGSVDSSHAVVAAARRGVASGWQRRAQECRPKE